MRILGIETSCDETAVCVLEAKGGLSSSSFALLGNSLYSQIQVHEKYGGVFPMMAKREHAANLVPCLLKALAEARMKSSEALPIDETMGLQLEKILEREPGLFEALLEHASAIGRPDIDAIAVTSGPGLEPALWVGVNFAKALSLLWNIPLIPVNHMEGHLVSGLWEDSKSEESRTVEFPAIALLISGGHTELILATGWTEYEILGRTRDDAVGEAFDKVARMLGLPYPGGPEISRLAALDRAENPESAWKLPRPMIHSDDLDFSFSGLKTAVLYLVKKMPELSESAKRGIAREFEDAVVEVLAAKTRKALDLYGAKTLIIGGGVTANKRVRESMESLAAEFPGLNLRLPSAALSTDNAVMIAMAGYVRIEKEGSAAIKDFKAEGNQKIGSDSKLAAR